MPAAVGLTAITIGAVGTDRTYSVERTTGTTDEDNAPGASFTLTFTWGTTGVPTFSQADSIVIEVRLPGAGAQLGGTTTWAPAITGNSGTETRTFHFDDDPLNQSAGTNRWGMVELFMTVRRNAAVAWGPVDSRGGGTPPAGNSILGSDQGVWRARAQLSSHSLSNVALAGAEPASFAYPDSIFLRGVLTAACYDSGTLTARLRSSSTDRRTKTSATTSTNRDFSWSAASEKVDTTTPAGTYDVRLDFTAASFAGINQFVWHDSGNQAGWTRTSELILDRSARFTLDPAVTLSALTNPDSGGTGRKYNRGETITGLTLDVKNARGEGFAPRGTESFTSISSGGASEQTFTVTAHDHNAGGGTPGRHTMNTTFATSGNVAPADLTGDAKTIRWRDSQGSSPTPADTGTYGILSSLYQVRRHLQVNNNTFDAGLETTQRLTSDLGFVTMKITNVRDEAVQTAVGTLAIRDHGDLTPEISFGSLSTDASGLFALQTWDEALPGGAWDLYLSVAATKNGNTTTMTRHAADLDGVSHLTLLATDPNIRMLVALSPADGAEGDHAHPGDPLRVSAALENANTRKKVAPDSGSMTVELLRYNPTLDRLEFLDSDESTWTAWTTNAAYAHTLTVNGSDATLFQKTFSSTAGWASTDVLAVKANATVGGTPYSGQAPRELVNPAANAHDSYELEEEFPVAGWTQVRGTR